MAQIVTITNPLTGQPAQVDQLEHTAQQIDDAVEKTIKTSGQGYDGASFVMPRLYLASGTEAEFEALLDAKLATMAVGSTIQAIIYDPNIMSGFSGYGTLSFDSNYAGGFAALTCNFVVPSGISDVERQATIIKVKTRGVWYPWEWVNPPMHLGVEYRTTERYLGKPVYVKVVDCGNLPASGLKNIAHGIANCKPIQVYGEMSNGNTLPYTTVASFCISADANYIQIYVTGDLSGQTVKATIKCTKTTD